MEHIKKLFPGLQIILYNVVADTHDTREFGHPIKQTLISTSYWAYNEKEGYWDEMFGYPNKCDADPNIRYPDNLLYYFPLLMKPSVAEVKPVGRFTIKTLKNHR